jgi:hypothetical protein
MPDRSDAIAKLEQVLGGTPKTWKELATKIANSNFPAEWKRDGVWATEVLSEVLGEAWGLSDRDETPYLRFVLAPQSLPQLVAIVEMAARIKVLENTLGAPGIYKSMKKDRRIDVIRHAWLQLEVAGLEKRRSGQVTLELDQGEGRWKPDVVIAGETDDPIYTECLWMTMSDEATKYLASSGKEPAVTDYWRRVIPRIVSKSGQPAQDGGWLRVEMDSGFFSRDQKLLPPAKSDFASKSLVDKAQEVQDELRQVFEVVGPVHGIVLSSPAMDALVGVDEECDLPGGVMALRRHLPGNRVRETFIVPNLTADSSSEPSIWFELYNQEPTWLDWALNTINRAAQ